MPKGISAHTIAALPQVRREIWELGRRPLHVRVAALQRQGEQPEILLAVQTGKRGGVVGHELVTSAAPVSALADFALRAMQQPMLGRPRRPQAVRVAIPAEAEELVNPLAEAGVWMEVSSPLTTLDGLHHELQEAMGGLVGGYRVLSMQAGELLSEEVLRAFFRVARTFYRGELWIDFSGAVLFEIELQPAATRPKTLYGILLGNMGQEFGLALYPSFEDLRRFHEVGKQHEEQLAPPPTSAHRRRPNAAELQAEAQAMATLLFIPCIGLTFTPQEDVPPPLVEEAKELKLPLANKSAFPLVMKTGQGSMQVAHGRDLQDMLMAMRAIIDWDKRITRMDVDDELDVPITSTWPAMGDTLPQVAARTTLRLNPCVPLEEDTEDRLPPELDDLLQSFLDALPPAAEKPRGTSGKTTASKTQKTTKDSTPSQLPPSMKGRRK